MSRDAGTEISTLVLVDDAEFELRVSSGALTFASWGDRDAHLTKRLCISLVSRGDGGSGAIPLVITAPFTTRFRLHETSPTATPLLQLLRENTRLEYDVEFVPPELSEPEYAWDNFQDQLVIQARLSRLTVRLYALRHAKSMDACDSSTLMPRTLPSVRAPALKLFDQIEKATRIESPKSSRTEPPSLPSVLLTTGNSFHPQKNPGMSVLEPMRRPVSPSLVALSRPASRERRTASPRVLEPMVNVPTPSAAVNNQLEAQEVIRRLRARQATMFAVHSVTPSIKNKPQAEDTAPTFPETLRVDGQAQAELDAFNAVVMAAKANVLNERERAKHELDYFKSILPKSACVEVAQPVISKPASVTSVVDPPKASSKPLKPAKLPTLAASSSTTTLVVPATLVHNNNQELSPVKTSRILTKTKKAPPRPEQDVPPSRIKPETSAAAVKSKQPKPLKAEERKIPVKKAMVAKAKTTKSLAPKPRPAVPALDEALDDFDDPDPEIDDAPVMPDDLGGMRALEDEELLLL
ncbi:hypothetical protein Poli38472_011454 [Pythium oligandrum]|uniref:Uncharacterized protein n=1 Tax=Pythium oligandrum TaxID=41045 RepID=A0A8K1FKV0_PYTOL|nr:hypothetical protein Poli38472_011454 [Pythium oligandrum]|eukprot:TMW64574.1 hypothetical protein Poli38472_011454 [Pythium oligandrum]